MPLAARPAGMSIYAIDRGVDNNKYPNDYIHRHEHTALQYADPDACDQCGVKQKAPDTNPTKLDINSPNEENYLRSAVPGVIGTLSYYCPIAETASDSTQGRLGSPSFTRVLAATSRRLFLNTYCAAVGAGKKVRE